MLKRKLTSLLVVVAASVAASSAFASHSWNGYHWARTSNPFTLQYVDSVDSTWDSVLDNAISHWDQSNVLDFARAGGDDSSKTRKRCPAIQGQFRVCNAAYGQNGWLGLASIGLDSNGHIDQGTAKMNDSYDYYFTPEEMNHVMCQEIGHVFGLGHTSEDGTSQKTCMDYSTDPNSQWPNSHDFQELSDIYAHVDSYNSYSDGGSSGGGGSGCNAPPGKGCNKSTAPGGLPMGLLVHHEDRYEIWVAKREDGGYWVHHVTLAPSRGNSQH